MRVVRDEHSRIGDRSYTSVDLEVPREEGHENPDMDSVGHYFLF